MRDARVWCIVAGIIVMLVIMVPMFGSYAAIPHGYDGIVSGVYEIEHDYEEYETYNTLYYAGVDPYMIDANMYPMQTGVRIQLSAPQFISAEDYEPVEKVEPHDQENELVTTQRAAIYEFEMSTNLETYGTGSRAIENVIFWIDLKNNDFTVFTNPNDVAVAILNVVTKEYEILQDGSGIEIHPEGVGFDAPLVTIRGEEPSLPDYVGDIVNIDNFKQLTHIKFPIYVNYASPTVVAAWDWRRVEAQVFTKWTIDVLVIGEWQELRPYHIVTPPPPDLDFWQILGAALGDIWEALMGPLGAVVVIIAIIGTVILLIKAQGIIRIVGIIGLWIAVLFVLSLIGLGVMAS